jgi:hypothetical protein
MLVDLHQQSTLYLSRYICFWNNITQWNEYEPGTVENFNGGTAGTFEIFNGVNSSPYGPNGTGPENIFNLTQSWYETVPTPSGSVSILHDAQDEFYDGEFEGSTLTITTQSLNTPFPNDVIDFSYTPVIYAPNLYSGNTFTTPIVLNDDSATYQFTQDQFLNNLTVPAQGEILLLDNFRIKSPPYTPTFTLSIPPFAYVKIHKIDNNNNNNGVALGQATRLRIKFTILNNYRLIGDIVETTEYPTYYLYKVQLLDFIYFNEANNYIKDYSVLASITSPFTTTLPENPPYIFQPTASINGLNYYNSSSGYTTLQNTPNIRLITTSSITIDNTSGTTPLFFLSYSTSDFSSIIASLPAYVTLPLGVSTYTISGSFIPLNGDSYVLTAISLPSTSLNIQNLEFQLTQSNNWSISTSPTSSVSCSLIIEPYITYPNFYNSDDNALLNSVNDQRENSFALDADYGYGTTPINFNTLIDGTATPATVPDSNYTSKKSTILKYEGSKSTSKLLNQWTQGDIGTYGKLPTVESLKTHIAYCDGIGGWPPEHENASAMNVLYLIKADGTVVIPNTSKDSLSIMQQTFLTGERVFISTKNGSISPLDPYRTVIRGGSHIEPILYTQSGSAPNAQFSGSILLQDVDLTNGTVSVDKSQDYRANPNTGTSISNFDPINLPLFIQTNQNNVPISTDSSYGFGYTVQSSTVNDGCNLTFTPTFRITNYSTFPGLTFKISLRKSTTPGSGISILVDSLTTDGYYPQFNVYGGPPQREYKAVFTVPSSDLEVNTIYFIEIQITSLGLYATFTGGSPFINHSTYGVSLKVTQYPTFITPFSSSGYNTIWGYGNKTTYPYIITSSKQQLTDNYGNPEIRMKSVEGTGFNQIQLPWSIKIGDEFRFEGREDWTYMVKNIFGPAESGSGRIFQTGSIEVHFNANLPVSASSTVFNLDHFLIRRYVDDAAQNIITGFRPPGSTGPYLIKPEFVVPELNKSIDEVILDLTQKGLIT